MASGTGVAVVPGRRAPREKPRHTACRPFVKPASTRRAVRAWRRTFTRCEAIAALRNPIQACPLAGVKRLS